MSKPLPSPYYVTVYERDNPSKKILARLGETPPTPSQGGGGYNVVSLPQRAAVTVWQGVGSQGSAGGGLWLMDMAIVLGGATTLDGASVDRNLPQAILMWRPAAPTQAPPVLKLRAAGSIVPLQNLPWVLSDFTWGDLVADQAANVTLRKLTLQFMEFRADERLQTITLRKPTKGSAVFYSRKYTVRAGDTLASIARRFGVGTWRDLANAQNPSITDPRNIFVGETLLIP